VQAEEAKNAKQQQIHEQSGEVERWKGFSIMGIGVGMVTDKTHCRVGVALAARRHKIAGSDRGLRVRGRKDVMEPVAIPTASGFGVSQGGDLGMESVEVGGVVFLVAVAARRGRLHLPRHPLDSRDSVCGVTIGANRRLGVSRLQLLAMDPGEILRFRPGMAGAARRGDVRSVGPTLGIRVAQDLVRSMATGTGRSDEQTILGEGEAVDGIHVQRIDISQAKLLS